MPKKVDKKSLAHYGLKEEETDNLVKMLDDAQLSSKQLVRFLLRQWMKNGGGIDKMYSIK